MPMLCGLLWRIKGTLAEARPCRMRVTMKAWNPCEEDLTAYRARLEAEYPAGAARNALDAALWDLEAKLTKIPVAQRLDLSLKPHVTAYTLSLDTPPAMHAAAEQASDRPLLKVKLGAHDDLDAHRIRAVRRGAPNARLVVDANEGWSAQTLMPLLHACADVGIELVEQPLPSAEDSFLKNCVSPVPLCADESFHTLKDVPRILDLYQAVNVKLDKAGGLTHALRVCSAARAHGLKIFIGCMVGSSLSLAPAFHLTPDAEWVDLDGAMLLAEDIENGLGVDGSLLSPPVRALWG
jgi:L-Ala-D/L-Glu epimerase